MGIALLTLLGISSVASAATLCVNPAGKGGCKSSIIAAVAAASPGDTIQVADGTYKGQVTITQSISIIAADDARPIIDATGKSNGILISGISAAPAAGVADVLISGLAVRNANFEGILVVNGTDITLVGNHVHDNNLALDIAASSCPGIPAFETNEGDDCGEGIHLMAVNHSSVIENDIDHNSGGILISDETGPNHDNLISRNSVHDNPFDCGITIASHGPAVSIIPTAKVSFGITHITIAHNASFRNGLQLPGAGAGVGIFAPFPGTIASGNVVIGNDLRDNGLPGVTMHNHAAAPAPAPPVNLNDNVIVGNHISGNAADTEDAGTSGPTGINVFSVAPITGTVISQNVIDDEAIDIAFKAPAGQLNVHLNDFATRGIGIENLGSGTINATDNWWNCPAGPGGKRCSSAVGSGIVTVPWLTFPFDPDNR